MTVGVTGPRAALVDRVALVRALKTLPFIEIAYEEQEAKRAVNPLDDKLAVLQGYLGPPLAGGISMLEAWALPGADGAGVRFVDVEWGWLLSHEDLAGAGIQVLAASPAAF